MNDINGMMKYSAVNKYGKYYSRSKKRSKREPTMKPLGNNLITNDGVNQQDGKENSFHALDNVKQPSHMAMFNASSKPIWSGIFNINSEACLKVDAQLSSKACKKVKECSRSMQRVLDVVKLPRLQVWPKGWESAGPTDACIGLFFFPSNSRSNDVDELVNEVIGTDSALKVTAAIADLLIFPSVVLPEQNHLYHGKHYLWGLFRQRKDISDEVVLCAVPADEGGQLAQHLLNQVDEAQPASPEQITCVMNDSHVENPPLVESICEAQIEEAMETVTGECLTTIPGSSLSGTKQPNSPKAVSNSSVHHPEEVSQPGDIFTSSSTKPNASSSVAAQLAEKTGHGQSCSSSEPLPAKLFGEDIARQPPIAQELIQDMATEGALVVSVQAEMVNADSVSGNSPAVGALPGLQILNPDTGHQQRSEEGEPPQPDVVASQACMDLFPVTEEQMGLAAPGVGTSNNMEVDLELRLDMPVGLQLHL